MATKNISVYGIFGNDRDRSDCLDDLRSAGFRETDVSILHPENEGNKDLAVVKRTKAAEGTALGATLGAIAGGILGWFLGTGAISLPELPQFASAGPMMAVLSGIGAGAVIIGIIGFLTGLPIPEYEVRRYSGRVRRGGILFSVHCDSREWAKTAKQILRRTGGQNVASTSEARADFGETRAPRTRTPAPHI